MKNYINRVVKYFLYLLILFAGIYGLMYATGFSDIDPNQFVLFLSTTKGIMMVSAVIGLSLLYPFYGVMSKKIDRIESADVVIKMQECGYKLTKKEGEHMIFNKTNFADRLRFRFDDMIEMDNSDETHTQIKGSRRAVVAVLFKIS